MKAKMDIKENVVGSFKFMETLFKDAEFVINNSVGNETTLSIRSGNLVFDIFKLAKNNPDNYTFYKTYFRENLNNIIIFIKPNVFNFVLTNKAQKAFDEIIEKAYQSLIDYIENY